MQSDFGFLSAKWFEKGLKKDYLVYYGILFGVQSFFTHNHAISAFSETGDSETIDKQGSDKLLAALKRYFP